MNQLKRILRLPLFRIVLGFIFSSLTIYLSLQNINIQQLKHELTKANLFFIGLAVISLVVNTLFKIIRWRNLLGLKRSGVSFSQIGISFLVSQMMNALLAFRAGEVSRIYILGRTGIERAYVLGTIAIEMVLNMIACSLLFVLLLLLIPLPNWIGASGYTYVIVVSIVSAIIFFATLYRSRLMIILDRWGRYIPGKLQPFILTQVRIGLSSLDVLRRQSEMFRLAIVTAVIWIMAVLTNHLVLQSLGLDLPMTASVLILIAMQVAIFIPSVPGRIGVFEYICILSLGVFGVSQTLALSYGILLHLVVYIPTIILGLVSFLALGLGGKQKNLTPVN